MSRAPTVALLNSSKVMKTVTDLNIHRETLGTFQPKLYLPFFRLFVFWGAFFVVVTIWLDKVKKYTALFASNYTSKMVSQVLVNME